MTRAEFLSAMAPLAVNYHQPLTRPLLTLWWTEFQHVLPDDFRDAVTEAIRTEPKFFPTLAQMRDRLGMNARGTLAEAGAVFEQLVAGRAPHYDPRHGDYWALPDVMERFGARALAAFMAAGGTRAFRDRTDRNIDFLRRDFFAGWAEFDRTPTPPDTFLRPGDSPAPKLEPVRDTLRRIMPGGPDSP